MKGHMHAVEHGFLLLLPVVDEAGRAIIYYDPSVFNERVLDAEEVRLDSSSKEYRRIRPWNCLCILLF